MSALSKYLDTEPTIIDVLTTMRDVPVDCKDPIELPKYSEGLEIDDRSKDLTRQEYHDLKKRLTNMFKDYSYSFDFSLVDKKPIHVHMIMNDVGYYLADYSPKIDCVMYIS